MNQVKAFFLNYTVRIERLIKHLVFIFFRRINHPYPPVNVREWTLDFIFYMLDIFLIAELYQWTIKLIKWNIRPLTEEEKTLGYKIFGNNIDFDKISVDDSAKIGTKNIAVAYVSFNIINYRHSIRKNILIHELMHIWQYQHFGSMYIGRAILAQRSKQGYDYGGVENLYKVMIGQGSLLSFNFEQQADIIEDYYRLMKNPTLAQPMVLHIYKYFADQLKTGHL